MNLFLDSSALAKRFLFEVGTARLRDLLSEAQAVGLCWLASAEVISAFCRLRREGEVSEAGYSTLKRDLGYFLEDCSIVSITDAVLARTVWFLERWPLRAADALHCACAAEWEADLFLSADARQCLAARAAGLAVEQLGRQLEAG